MVINSILYARVILNALSSQFNGLSQDIYLTFIDVNFHLLTSSQVLYLIFMILLNLDHAIQLVHELFMN